MSLPRILITAGEPAGIGPDIILRALQTEIAAQVAVVADANVIQQRADMLGVRCEVICLEDPRDVTPHAPNKLQIIHIPCTAEVNPGVLNAENSHSVISTLEMSAKLTRDAIFDAVVTTPVQKSIINESGIAFSGHTEFFAEFFSCSDVVMLLANQQFKVALATTHLPLRAVADAISQESLLKQLRVIHDSFSDLYGIENPSIAMLGLNPHAGEGGYLGTEEIEVLIPACEAARRCGINVSFPLPADTAFISDQVKTADVVLAMYHDQGLPVLKTAGFGDSVNITLGLPVIRTSVDHGTALTLAGTGTASEGSLLAAINEALVCAWRRR